MTIRVFEAFAGVGSQRMALRNLGIDHEVVAIAEIDKFAIKSYEAIHGETNNLGDISQLGTDDIPDHDLFTYSFPCQDISVAGQGLGLDEGSGTRSGLLWECQKVIAGKKPKYLMLENVKNLVSKRHKHNFDNWLEWLEEQGYANYWEVLNAKDYGIPQNRERVFVVSILGEHELYEFPEPIELELRLKDVLESEVDEKFYLSDEKTKTLIANPQINESLNGLMEVGSLSHYKRNDINRVYSPQGNCPTLNTMQGGDRQPKVLIKNATKKGYLEATHGDGVDLAYPDSETRRGRVQSGLSQTLDTSDNKGVVIAASRGRNQENPSDRTVGNPTEQRLEINKQGTSNTITTVQKDNYVVEPLGTLAAHNSDKFGTGYMDGVSKTLKANKHDISVVERVTGLNKVDNSKIKPINPLKGKTDNGWHFEQQVYDSDGITRTVKAGGGSGNIPKTIEGLRIRKLTPKECWRLMGFSDDDFYRAEEVNSNSQLYKQAGNSIVVDVLEAIFKQLLEV